MNRVTGILGEVDAKSQKLHAVRKEDVEFLFNTLSNRRGYRDKVYKPFKEILQLIEDFLEYQLNYFGPSFEQFQVRSQNKPEGLEILIIHKNGFNACGLFKVISEADLFCLMGNFLDSEENQSTFNDLGIQAQNRGDFAAALDYFEKGFKIGNSSQSAKADIKDRMATCCMELGRNKDAVKYWEEALQMKNWYPDERAAIEADIRRAKSRI